MVCTSLALAACASAAQRASPTPGAAAPTATAVPTTARLATTAAAPPAVAPSAAATPQDPATRIRSSLDVTLGSAAPATVAAVGRGAGFAVTNATALAWIDSQTGALMKLPLSFDKSIFNPPTSQTEVGKDRGRVELAVTQVGKATVKLP